MGEIEARKLPLGSVVELRIGPAAGERMTVASKKLNHPDTYFEGPTNRRAKAKWCRKAVRLVADPQPMKEGEDA